MAKSKSKFLPVTQAINEITGNSLKPIYFLSGEDNYSIEHCLKLLEEKVSSQIETEFDKEVFYGEDTNMLDIINFASAFPFGSGKKFVTVKDFEKIKDKKNLIRYVESPPDFTFLVLINNGTVSNPDSALFEAMNSKGFAYEAKELKGSSLNEWLMGFAESKGKVLTRENAQYLVDIVGENRTMLEAQIEKITVFLNMEKEITLEVIRSLSTALKEYTIFDLQNALALRKKEESLKVAFGLLEKGAEPTYIIHMLTRYFTGLSRINELKEKNIPDNAAARIVGTHPYYYKDHIRARSVYSDMDLYRIAGSLLKADISVKTTTTDNKSVVSLLIAEILN